MKSVLTVCTYNVGKWTDGMRPGLMPNEIFGRISAWSDFLKETDPDLLLCEEATEYFDAAGTVNSCDTLFGDKYPYIVKPQSGNRLTDEILICSKFPVENMRIRSFLSGSGRPFVTFSILFEGRKLTFAVVHLSIEADSAGLRQKDVAELAAMIENGNIDIITGDFNTFCIEEFDIFNRMAFLANHGDYGDFETWPHTAGKWNRCIDNIIVSRNLSISSVQLGTHILSDHMPLIAQIV